MAERLKDEADLKLESMFGSVVVRDNGFSDRVVSQVRRQMWVRRLSLPLAVVIGTAISAKPIFQLIEALPGILATVPGVERSLQQMPISGLPGWSAIVWGMVLVGSALMAGKMLED